MEIRDINVLMNGKKINYDAVELDNKNSHPYFSVKKDIKLYVKFQDICKKKLISNA